MMGRSHVATAGIVGCLLASGGVLIGVPGQVTTTLILVTAGSGLLPDLDHPGSKVSRTLGPFTKVLSHGVAAISAWVYHTTRLDKDSSSATGTHRYLTHTIPGCLFFGVLVAAVALLSPWYVTSVVLVVLILLASAGFRWKIGLIFLAVLGLVVMTIPDPGAYWWLWGLAVATGAISHVLGDACTNSGVPLLWPLARGGKRWGRIKTRKTLSTGNPGESLLCNFVFTPVFFLSVAVVVYLDMLV